MSPLLPPPALLCLLGSCITHADEFLSEGGHPVDRVAFESCLTDPAVQEWLQQMRAQALVPEKRV